MSYLTQGVIAENGAMRTRIAQAYAIETDGTEDADQWTYRQRRYWAAAPGWDAAWEYSLNTHPDDGDPATEPYDPGSDEAVITDGQILSQIQAMLAESTL